MKLIAIYSLILFFPNALFSQKQSDNLPDGSTQLFIGGGIAINSVKKYGSNSGVEIDIDHPASYAPSFVIGSKFTINNTRNSFFIAPAIRIYSINSTAKKDLTSGLATYHHTSTFKVSPLISPTADFGYNIIKQQGFKWYISAGLGLAFLINGKDVQSNYYDPSNSEITFEGEPTSMIFVFNTQTGFDIGKHLGIWFFYQPPTSTSYNNSQKKVQISSLQTGLSYFFNL